MRLLLTVFVVLALAGCGSSESTETGANADETEAGAEEESSTDDSSRDAGPDDDPDKGTDDESDDAATDDDADDPAAGDSDGVEDGDDDDDDDTEGEDTEGEDPADTEDEDDDVGEIDPDDIELNPEALEPDDKTTPSIVPPGSGSYDGALEPLVEQAMADLETRLGIETSAIGVHSASAKTWPDSSAGCPQPGMAYTQVVTEGTEIVLMVNGTSYRYTTGGALSAPRLCET